MQRSRSFQFFDPFGVGLGGMRAALMIKRLGSDQVGNLGLKVAARRGRHHELHRREEELFTPVHQEFYQSRNRGADDPHQNLIVIHTPRYLVNKKRHVKRASVFLTD